MSLQVAELNLGSRGTASDGIVERLEALVQGGLRGRLRDFEIDSRPEGLVLRGRTCTYYVKQLAQHLVMNEVGPLIHANQIEVH